MKRKIKGFTLIEVALFLAITGAIFAGVIIGTQNSIWQQRTNDTVQGFAEFLRGIYSSVSNPQGENNQSGKSGQAIYGRLLVFGESERLGKSDDGDDSNAQQIAYVYTVIGDADPSGSASGDINEALINIEANVLVDNNGIIDYAGIVDSYIPRWAAQIEPVDKLDEPFKGSILIVRHPVTGVIRTLYSSTVVQVNETKNGVDVESSYTTLLTSVLKNGGFAEGSDIDFCINPYGSGERYNNRYDVRIVKGANNASGVEVVDRDTDQNKCKLNA